MLSIQPKLSMGSNRLTKASPGGEHSLALGTVGVSRDSPGKRAKVGVKVTLQLDSQSQLVAERCFVAHVTAASE